MEMHAASGVTSGSVGCSLHSSNGSSSSSILSHTSAWSSNGVGTGGGDSGSCSARGAGTDG